MATHLGKFEYKSQKQANPLREPVPVWAFLVMAVIAGAALGVAVAAFLWADAPPSEPVAPATPTEDPCPSAIWRGQITDAGTYQLGRVAFTIPEGVNLTTKLQLGHNRWVLTFYPGDTDEVANQVGGESVASIIFTPAGNLEFFRWNGEVFDEIGGDPIPVMVPQRPTREDPNPPMRQLIVEGSTAGPTLEQMHDIIRSLHLSPSEDPGGLWEERR